MKLPLTPIRFLQCADRQFPQKTAVIDGDRRFTYSQFAERCRRLAGVLKAWNLPRGARVAYLAYNTHPLLEGYYGVLMAGCVLLPLNIRLSTEDFVVILNHSQARVLLFHSDFSETVEAIRPRLENARHFLCLDRGQAADWADPESYDDRLAGSSPDLKWDPFALDEDEVAEIFYTSGTTGRPKGVMLTHRNLYLHGLEAGLAVGTRESDVHLHTIPLFHVNGWGAPQTLTGMGGTHVMLPAFDPAEVFRLIEEHRVSVFFLVPTMATALVNHPDASRYDLSSVRMISLGGAAANSMLVEQVERTFGCLCVSGYGLTETSPVVTLSRPKSHLELDDADRLELQAMTGYPIPGAEVEIVDGNGSALPWDGETVGEIVVRSNGVMKGYFGDDEENLRLFQDGWFHTGDMATIDSQGYVLIVDRKKDIIISGGENISSLEIEKALLSHPAVLECAVIAVPDGRWGEVPKALVVLKAGSIAAEEELIRHARERLASFKCPKSVEFFDSLPKGGTGKILKRELREQYWKDQKKRVH
ncbi:MAG TPA: long-chain-fatty-acid--CoA ligase [Acidobacteriota bacterium]|nr:long-chain-fatty-acid--CoA ligase [Acidobacteriota bacterium]